MMAMLVKIFAIGIMIACMVTVAGCENHSKTFLALGDSFTIGESVPDSQRWPVQLAAMLRKDHVDVAHPMIIAKTGWTTDELSAAIDAAKIDGKQFDLVTLLIGVNNQYRSQPSDEY